MTAAGPACTCRVAAGSGAVVNLVAPGVLATWPVDPVSQNPATICDEDQQALILAYSLQFVASTPWPYVGPMFVYCWSDASSNNNAGPFGLTASTARPSPLSPRSPKAAAAHPASAFRST